MPRAVSWKIMSSAGEVDESSGQQVEATVRPVVMSKPSARGKWTSSWTKSESWLFPRSRSATPNAEAYWQSKSMQKPDLEQV